MLTEILQNPTVVEILKTLASVAILFIVVVGGAAFIAALANHKL